MTDGRFFYIYLIYNIERADVGIRPYDPIYGLRRPR